MTSFNFFVPFVVTVIAYAFIFIAIRRQINRVSDLQASSTDQGGSARDRPRPEASAGGSTGAPARGGGAGPLRNLGKTIRSSRNLFIMCAVYWVTYFPLVILPFLLLVVQLTSLDFIYSTFYFDMSAPVANGVIYIALHRAVSGSTPPPS